MFARTKRLTLRPGWPEDAAALAQAIAHECVATRLARMPWPYQIDDAVSFLSVPRAATDPSFLIFSHEADYPQLVGAIGLRAEGGWWELGYWLTPDAWGRGYATEAGRAVLHTARHALPPRPIRAYHQLANPASGRVLAKLGLRKVGEGTRYCLAQDREVACAVYEGDVTEDERTGDMPIAA